MARICNPVERSTRISTPTSTSADSAWISAAMNDSRMPRRTVCPSATT